MQSITLKPGTQLICAIVGLGLTMCDIAFATRVMKQNALINDLQSSVTLGTPKDGVPVPMLTGFNTLTNAPGAVLPAQSPPFALLVFREGCHFCDDNWKNWESLFPPGRTHRPVIFISTDKTVSDEYVKKHPMLLHNTVLLGADTNALASMHLGLTPQTVYIVGGKVSHDWPGLLTESDVKEIRNATSPPVDD